VTLVRGFLADTPSDPFRGAAMRTESDGGLLVRDGIITARGGFADLQRDWPQEPVLDLRGGVVLPGFIDTHVHFPQVRIVGSLGMPLLDWLQQRALPEEARLADAAYAHAVATEFVTGLARAGTTSALVFGAHFPDAVSALFEAAERVGLRVTSGLVVSDLLLRDDLLITPELAQQESLTLARRWHGHGRARYAVTPRFSLSCTDAMLASCADVLDAVPGALFTSHVNENPVEIAQVRTRFGTGYVDSYDRHRLVGRHTVLAHNVHADDAELRVLAERGAVVAHCPSSNSGLGSGLFPMRRHLEQGVRVALGTDVGGGTSLSMLREGLQAFFVQQLLGPAGVPLGATELLWLATAAGADALGLAEVGHLSVGRRFDAVWVRPAPGSPLEVPLHHAESETDAVARVFTLASPMDVAGVWIDGDRVPG
jgi:guanine deaminase